ncbi:hypothetical protein B0T24DRAFT_708743 [Lasiosphaeria ovina]|uniref:Protein kinase domain-containing protein n=1 Tax=Lasiosphaeria ovina TaxID=92902 RepID=A0AAE0K4A2_9PEZI|nr:hypothetical protein B0T24DRAFT_708743 [Lasiosphaeria ovina]
MPVEAPPTRAPTVVVQQATSVDPLPVPVNSQQVETTSPSLEDRIIHTFATSKYEGSTIGQDYVPEGTLDKLITEAAVGEKLGNLTTPPKLLGFILSSAKKIFAISVLTVFKDDNAHNCRAMETFFDQHITDDALPILQNSASGEVLLKTFGLLKAKQFFDFWQWKFIVPVFEDGLLEYKVASNVILPFRGVENGSMPREGTFGTVFEVTVHEAHRKSSAFLVEGSRTIAVKEIDARKFKSTQPGGDYRLLGSDEVVKEAWAREAAALRKLSEVKHDHLIQCIAAIEKGDKFYFLFPWAAGGSLRDFWNTTPQPNLSPEFIEQVLVQFCGLSHALNKLHTYRGRTASFRQDADLNDGTISGGGIRHGDLKPENILRFAPEDDRDVGTLKIADMGLAKHHEVSTNMRQNVTSTKHGTARYEPPEVEVRVATTRLYDVWSMGCIILELLIWLVEGTEALNAFNQSIRGDKKGEPPYYETQESDSLTGQGKKAKVHSLVTKRIRMLETSRPCAKNTALGDLLDVVKTKLLVVELPASSDSNSTSAVPDESGVVVTVADASDPTGSGGPCRASAETLHNSIVSILAKGDADKSYFYTGPSRPAVGGLTNPSQLAPHTSGGLHPSWALSAHGDRKQDSASGSSPLAPTQMRENLDINVWDYTPDNQFAAQYLSKLRELSQQSPFPKTTETDQLCSDCEKLDLTRDFHLDDKLSELRARAESCRFCKMRWEVASSLENKTVRVRFKRVGSVIKMNESDPPVFSIFRTPVADSKGPEEFIQIGLPVLPEVGSAAHFQLIKLWLRDCDKSHGAYKCTSSSPSTGETTHQIELTDTESKAGDENTDRDDLEQAFQKNLKSRRQAFRLPTRLIHIGYTDSPTVYLYETQANDTVEGFAYMALSHRWGVATPETPPFCTTAANRADHMERGIAIEALPQTFRDAVTTTRALGLQYLWIDSICIVQGAGGDFGSECKRMEDVFSAAHCVVAATCARGQWDGFLKPRPQRDYVTLGLADRSSGPPVFVCRYIDDFNGEVLKGDLNKRGWVLQERALARRTVYLAGRQTYFECGAGVRCETLTKMHNQAAGFIGDANFPELAILSTRSHGSGETSRGERILYFQELYMTYSRLDFSQWEDRAVAMEGLEQRLMWGFKSRGRFGILAGRSLLPRSLLWRRGASAGSLTRILFPAGRQRVPSWSWMAYRGGIDYLHVPFDGVEWETGDALQSPWDPADAVHTAPRQDQVVPVFRAKAREFGGGGDMTIVYDVTGMSHGPTSSVRCVVVGRAKGRPGVAPGSKRHYVLIVAPKPGGGAAIYQRVGVGFMLGKAIDFAKPGLDIKIE